MSEVAAAGALRRGPRLRGSNLNCEESPARLPLPTEEYGKDEQGVWRRVIIGSITGPKLHIECSARGSSQDALRKAWDQAWLRGALPMLNRESSAFATSLRIVDLFSGCGAMSLGVRLATESFGLHFESLLAADLNDSALDTYKLNFQPKTVLLGDLAALVSFIVGADGRLETASACAELTSLSGKVDLLIGGPPCQGHSDLNNHSRRTDPKNSLYLLVPAVAAVLKPRAVMIENVPAVVHDKMGVVATTERWLKDLGYHVVQAPVTLARIGIAQRRRRHVLLATLGSEVDLVGLLEIFETKERTTRWAMGDLADSKADIVFDRASVHTGENKKRIDWLFEKMEYDLPNCERPRCHRDKKHTYVSMYGRIRWDEPAQTVTSGYGSPGQGRYVHPSRRRTLTPHEAARLQFFPDSFRFIGKELAPTRTQLADMIGNAVPPKLSYILALLAIAACRAKELLAEANVIHEGEHPVLGASVNGS